MKLFRPHRIIPNTLDPGLANLDWIAIDNMFRNSLSSHGQSIVESISGDVGKNLSEDYVSVELDSWVESASNGEKRDAALKNLEGGNETIGLAARWKAPDEWGLKKLQRIRDNLPESLKVRLEKVTSGAEARAQALAEDRLREESYSRSELSEESDEDRYDDRGNTAHRIFAGSSFVQSERGSSVPIEEEARFHTPVSSPRRMQDHRKSLTGSPTPPSGIFNQEYANWFTPVTPTKERTNPPPKTPEPKKTMNILLPSANKANTVYRPKIPKSHLEVIPNPTSHILLPSNLIPAPSSTIAPFTSTLSSSSTKGNSNTPSSPSVIARRDKRKAEREERRRIALKLGRARPDLVSKEFTNRFLVSKEEQP